MDKIFTSATLTIIVGTGENVDAGFLKVPNACRRRPQVVQTIGGLRLVALWAPLANILRSTTWGSRAWTLQEYIFSKRALIFTKEQAYYRCTLEDPAKIHAWSSLPKEPSEPFPVFYGGHMNTPYGLSTIIF
jgi:hypothetical protein